MCKKKELNKDEALAKAARLCSGSEHCVSQIREKLTLWGVPENDANDIVERLVEEKYIDNMRFSRAYCHDKFLYSHWGRVKIRKMLHRLRLNDEEIAEGMSTIPDETYTESLTDALQAKDRTLRDSDAYRRKGKLVRHLLSRGFEMEQVLEAVDAYLRTNNADSC